MRPKFLLSAPKRFLLFILVTFLCAIIGSVVVSFIMFGQVTPARVRIATLMQDIIMFVAPALITAMFITRRPADFLMVGRAPRISLILVTLATQIASIPLMNAIIAWNQSIHLPDAFAEVEQMLRSAEENAEQLSQLLLSGTGIGTLIMGFLIIAIAAGFSEEMYFRGTLQRLLVTTRVNRHLAVWLAAVIFSAMHMQFFGFVPRMLLGAFFGYLALWTGNLWLPIIAHSFNNAMAVWGMWLVNRDPSSFDINSIGASAHDVAPICISVAFTVSLLILIYHLRPNRISCD